MVILDTARGGTDMDFGTQLRVMRIVRHWQQRELAKASGVPISYISFLESGRMLPTPDQARKLKAALGWPANAEVAFDILERDEGEKGEAA